MAEDNPEAEGEPKKRFSTKKENPTLEEQQKQVPAEEFKMDWDQAQAHLDDLEEKLKKYQGMADHNPFQYIKNFIQPLRTRIESGDRSQNLYIKINNERMMEPTLENIRRRLREEGTIS